MDSFALLQEKRSRRRHRVHRCPLRAELDPAAGRLLQAPEFPEVGPFHILRDMRPAVAVLGAEIGPFQVVTGVGYNFPLPPGCNTLKMFSLYLQDFCGFFH